MVHTICGDIAKRVDNTRRSGNEYCPPLGVPVGIDFVRKSIPDMGQMTIIVPKSDQLLWQISAYVILGFR